MTSFDWSPGIGDPSFMGWLTVVLYVLAALSCWFTASSRRVASDIAMHANEPRVWRTMAVTFLALGINKQMNLLSALTEAGRVIARMQGWYGERQPTQLALMTAVAILCVIAAIIVARWTHKAPTATWLALAGTILLIGFVAIRAVSLHAIDHFLGQTVFNLRWNWIVEIGGIGIVLATSCWRRFRAGKSRSDLA
jgi:hypothetical protein